MFFEEFHNLEHDLAHTGFLRRYTGHDRDVAVYFCAAPYFVEFGRPGQVRLIGDRMRVDRGTTVGKVTMFRTGSVTHELHNDYRLLILNFTQEGSHLTVDMPFRPAQAIAGDYMLFVVDDNGTPSMSKHVRLKLDRSAPVAPDVTPPTPSSRVSLFTAALRR
jgi:hypothetical protein